MTNNGNATNLHGQKQKVLDLANTLMFDLGRAQDYEEMKRKEGPDHEQKVVKSSDYIQERAIAHIGHICRSKTNDLGAHVASCKFAHLASKKCAHSKSHKCAHSKSYEKQSKSYKKRSKSCKNTSKSYKNQTD